MSNNHALYWLISESWFLISVVDITSLIWILLCQMLTCKPCCLHGCYKHYLNIATPFFTKSQQCIPKSSIHYAHAYTYVCRGCVSSFLYDTWWFLLQILLQHILINYVLWKWKMWQVRIWKCACAELITRYIQRRKCTHAPSVVWSYLWK